MEGDQIVRVGFTGTRAGMTRAQQETVFLLLIGCEVLHHGDCIGADAEAHELVKGARIVIHPPEDDRYRAFCAEASRVLPTKPYLERNHDIVDACDILIAAPRTEQEERRSGTWATIRYARTRGKPVIIANP